MGVDVTPDGGELGGRGGNLRFDLHEALLHSGWKRTLHAEFRAHARPDMQGRRPVAATASSARLISAISASVMPIGVGNPKDADIRIASQSGSFRSFRKRYANQRPENPRNCTS
jgi:hypothetical protein